MTDTESVVAPSSNRDPADPINPAPEFARLRAEKPLVRVQQRLGDGQLASMWLVTRHADVRELLASPSTSTISGRASSTPAAQPGFLLSLDPPDHTRIRRMLTREFSVRRMTALRPWIEQVVAGFLDDMAAAGPPADLMDSFALPVPSLVICELLGVPYEDRADFQHRSDVMLDFVDAEQQQRNTSEMNAYMADLVARHRRDPGEDILGMLIRDHGDDVTDAELVGIGNILLVAGHETTANTIGLGTLLLLQHPQQLALVRDDPDVLRTAVEEILRFLSIVQSGSPRVITEDITIAGQVIPAGDVAVVSLPSANRDTDLLPDADVFDATRPPSRHIAFGHGIHQCLGQQLARMEMAVAFPALLGRFPQLRLAAAPAELTFRGDGPVNGVRALPVTW